MPQVRAARALSDWTQPDLAKAAGIALATLKRFEKGHRTPIPVVRAAIFAALEKAVLNSKMMASGWASALVFARWRNKPIPEPDIGYSNAMPTFTLGQVRAARVFLGWTRVDLGEAAGLSLETIRSFERDEQSATTKSVDAIRTAFHGAGVDFLKHGKRVGVTVRR